MSKIVSSPIALIVRTLKDYEVDGESMEELIREVGMEDQMLRQLIMGADIDIVKQLIEEKEQLEAELKTKRTEIYYVNSFTTHRVDLMYKGTAYGVEIQQYCDDFDKDYKVTVLVNDAQLPTSDPIYDDLITFVEESIK